MKCFYHVADLDGHCSGAIVKYFEPECELIPFDYGMEFPWEIIDKNEIVYMVDVSLPPSDMERLIKLSNLIWIDHHKSAIISVEDYCGKITGIQDVRNAACQLCWQWFNERLDAPEFISDEVTMLGLYDSWKWKSHSNSDDILAFQMGMRLYETDPSKDYNMKNIWIPIFEDRFHEEHGNILVAGKSVIRYQEQTNKRSAEQLAFETELIFKDHAWSAICMNRSGNSQIFDTVYDPEKHELMMSFIRTKDQKWRISLYATRPEIDAGAIAKRFGGGGHPGAAGFICDELPFKF